MLEYLQVFVNVYGKILTLNVSPLDTIETVKELIKKKTSVPIKHQRLTFASKNLENGRLLADYEVRNLSTIDVSFRLKGGMHVFVKTLTGKSIAVEVQPDETVNSLQLKIELKEGIPVRKQRLTCGLKQLNEELTLRDCDIQNLSTLHLNVRDFGRRQREIEHMECISGNKLPTWVPDREVRYCKCCKKRFTFFFRRKHVSCCAYNNPHLHGCPSFKIITVCFFPFSALSKLRKYHLLRMFTSQSTLTRI